MKTNQDSKRKLEARKAEGELLLKEQPIPVNAYQIWEEATRSVITAAFPNEPGKLQCFDSPRERRRTTPDGAALKAPADSDKERTETLREQLDSVASYLRQVDRHDEPELAASAVLQPNSPPAAAETRKSARPATRKKPASSGPGRRILPYAILSLASFICALVLVGLLLWKAETIVALGLTGGFYYLVLLPLGLATAAFLFGALRSFALYSGKHLGGTLELGGPIVGCALVVIGGFVLPKPDADAFAVTAYVQGESGQQDLVLRNAGLVWMTLGADRRAEKIGDKGQADFKGIPSRFRGKEVPVSVEADGFELADPAAKYRLEGDQLYIPVRKKSGHVVGRVQDDKRQPVVGADVMIGTNATKSDASGHFDLSIPGEQLKPELLMQVLAPGYQPFETHVVPNANEAKVQLQRNP